MLHNYFTVCCGLLHGQRPETGIPVGIAAQNRVPPPNLTEKYTTNGTSYCSKPHQTRFWLKLLQVYTPLRGYSVVLRLAFTRFRPPLTPPPFFIDLDHNMSLLTGLLTRTARRHHTYIHSTVPTTTNATRGDEDDTYACTRKSAVDSETGRRYLLRPASCLSHVCNAQPCVGATQTSYRTMGH